jgi:hypothetical protein
MFRVGRLAGLPIVAGSVAEMSMEWQGVIADMVEAERIEADGSADAPGALHFTDIDSETYRQARGEQ